VRWGTQAHDRALFSKTASAKAGFGCKRNVVDVHGEKQSKSVLSSERNQFPETQKKEAAGQVCGQDAVQCVCVCALCSIENRDEATKIQYN